MTLADFYDALPEPTQRAIDFLLDYDGPAKWASVPIANDKYGEDLLGLVDGAEYVLPRLIEYEGRGEVTLPEVRLLRRVRIRVE